MSLQLYYPHLIFPPPAKPSPPRQQPHQSRSQTTTPSEHPLPNQIYSLLSILRGRYHLDLIRLKDRCPITVHHKRQPVILKNRIRIQAINRARTLFQFKRIIQFLPDRSFHLKTMLIKSIQRTEIKADKRETCQTEPTPLSHNNVDLYIPTINKLLHIFIYHICQVWMLLKYIRDPFRTVIS